MLCGSCGHENPDGVKYCSECGVAADAARRCSDCGALNLAGSKFCHECSTPLAAAGSTRTDPPLARAAMPQSFASGRYTVKGFLGEGGRKRVYLSHDTRLDRDVAFAVIKTEGLDADGLVRVWSEAQ